MRAFTISGIILPGIGEMAPALFLCCAVYGGLIRKQIAQILGLGIGNLCEAGRPEGLPFFWQNWLKNVTLFVLKFGDMEGRIYLCQ